MGCADREEEHGHDGNDDNDFEFFDATDSPHDASAATVRELREAHAAFAAAVVVLPKHVAARHGLGAAHFALWNAARDDAEGSGGRSTEHLKRGHEEWLAAIAAHDDDIARIRGQIISFTPPPDPPLVAAMRSALGAERVLAPPKPAAPRAPVWGSMRAIRRWKEEQVALAQALVAAQAENSAGAPGAGAREALAT